MAVTLEQILLEIKSLRKDMDDKFVQYNKEIREEMNQRFAEQRKEIREEMNQRFNQQSKEIAEEIRNVVDFMVKRQDKQIKDTKKEFKKEIKSNKVAHDGYNAKMYKLELGQSNLECKVYDLENN